MGKGESNWFVSLSRQRSIQILTGVCLFYIILFTLEAPFVFKTGFSGDDNFIGFMKKPSVLQSECEDQKDAPIRPLTYARKVINPYSTRRRIREFRPVSSLDFDGCIGNSTGKDGLSGIQKLAKQAIEVGKKLWNELESGKIRVNSNKTAEKNRTESCLPSITLSGSEFLYRGKIMLIPCGLTLGSHITVVGKPKKAHAELDPEISRLEEDKIFLVSQFKMELQGLETADGEDPPRILHFNPRLKGDWSGLPVIELNTCYRMQWGTGTRCEGWKSNANEETVDDQVKCEKWIRDSDDHSEELKATWWLSRLIDQTKKVTIDWPYPFAEDRLFVLTLSAGLEGYHINVDGRHITSFPYHTGFALEDATGLSLNGDVDVHSIFAASLPTSRLSFARQIHLDMSTRWKVPPLPDGPVELFIGILSAGNHFAERMAVRKSWMQHKLIKSSNVVARFFVALHAWNEVNIELKKEAEFFGDIVMVPYMDNYDLVVLKTVAICEYGLRAAAAKYIMKCDDDTFVRVDAVIDEANKITNDKSLYIGNINYYHSPLRNGKWAVTFEEWPEEDYPPYANGQGYIVSSDIAEFIMSEFDKHKLRLFKMEDVSMGMWVEQFNRTRAVEYVHSMKFCQSGCVEDYYTAHYQSPWQMMCMWNKLQQHGKPQCCNM